MDINDIFTIYYKYSVYYKYVVALYLKKISIHILFLKYFIAKKYTNHHLELLLVEFWNISKNYQNVMQRQKSAHAVGKKKMVLVATNLQFV